MWVLVGVLAGFALPVQTVINTRLRHATGTPLSSSLISFSVGTIALVAATLADAAPLPHPAWLSSYPAWLFLGGFLGVIVLTGNILLFPRLGAVQTVVLPITGQVLMGLLIDHFALFGAPQTTFSPTRALGAIIVLTGVVLTVGRGTSSQGWSAWQLAGIMIGALSSCQAAINGQLGQQVGSALSAALVSFLLGTLTLVLANLLTRWRPRVSRGPWWMWTGGVLGAVFVFANAALVPVLGTGVTVVATLVGLLACGLVIDRVHGARISWLQVGGLVLLGLGVATIRLF